MTYWEGERCLCRTARSQLFLGCLPPPSNFGQIPNRMHSLSRIFPAANGIADTWKNSQHVLALPLSPNVSAGLRPSPPWGMWGPRSLRRGAERGQEKRQACGRGTRGLRNSRGDRDAGAAAGRTRDSARTWAQVGSGGGTPGLPGDSQAGGRSPVSPARPPQAGRG